jgi:hypothetical protein
MSSSITTPREATSGCARESADSILAEEPNNKPEDVEFALFKDEPEYLEERRKKLRAANRALKLKLIAIVLFGLTLCYLLVHHRGVVLFFLLIVMPW